MLGRPSASLASWSAALIPFYSCVAWDPRKMNLYATVDEVFDEGE